MDLQFSQTGKRWSIEEDQQLINEYNAGSDIVEISLLHKRLPNGIASRLVLLNLIVDKKMQEDIQPIKIVNIIKII